MRFFALLLGVLFYTNLALAQLDTAVLLPAAQVTATPLRTGFTGAQEQSWDSTALERYTGNYLMELLEREGGVFIKNYGGGSLATTTIRGGSAGHTAITWNGLPLQSPMLGQLDFALLPLAFVDGVTLQRGGGSAAWGSGAIGGTIGLRNTPLSYQGVEAGTQNITGSFGLRDHQIRLRYRKNKWAVNTRLFRRSANNDFRFALENGAEREQTHAEFQQDGLLQEVYWLPKRGHKLAAYAWLQTSDRNIPPTTVQTRSTATQQDTFIRTALHYQHQKDNGVLNARLGWFREAIDYNDEAILLESLSHFHTITGEVEQQWALSARTRAQIGLFYTWATAVADGYRGTQPEQNQAAVFASVRHEWNKLEVQASLRQAYVDGERVPLVPALGLSGDLIGHLDWRAKVSYNYRVPTLNDLFWQPGGNQGLRPESGWSSEAGIVWAQGNWSYQATGFNRRISNWILWGIIEGQNFWSANNLTEVWSRGLEQRLSYSRDLLNWHWEVQLGYDYIRSTNEVALAQPKMDVGAQLAYTPEHMAFARFSARGQGFQLTYQHRLVGEVETLNLSTLSGYQLGFLQVQYHTQWRKLSAQIFGRADNLWGANYRVLERRAMPGRNYQFGINIFFKHKY